jgi:hypothetical protein
VASRAYKTRGTDRLGVSFSGRFGLARAVRSHVVLQTTSAYLLDRGQNCEVDAVSAVIPKIRAIIKLGSRTDLKVQVDCL